MSNYKAPTRDLLFSTVHLGDLEGVSTLPGYDEVTPELVEAILQEAAKVGEEVLAPLNQVGDQQGVKLTDGKVQTPDGWKEAYQTFIEGGWNGLAFDQHYGGQGLPWLVALRSATQATDSTCNGCRANSAATKALRQRLRVMDSNTPNSSNVFRMCSSRLVA